MFSGIIETSGTITKVQTAGSNRTFFIKAAIAPDLKADQSLAHNGVCLTVEEINGSEYKVTAIEETLSRSNLGSLKEGDIVNLERSLRLNDRLDGHLVQGHVDCTAKLAEKKDRDGSYELTFSFPEKYASLLIEKGSIALNGISLTVFNVSKNRFTVAIIPYTWENTNLKLLKINDFVNIEFDLIGKYVLRNQQLLGSA